MECFLRAMPTVTPVVHIVINDNGWREPSNIIEIISSVMTFAVVILTIMSNYTAKKALQASIKTQEQQRNLDLMDSRLKLLEELEKMPDRLLSSRKSKVTILFCKPIIDDFDELCALVDALQFANDDKNVYEGHYSVPDGFGSTFAEIGNEIQAYAKWEQSHGNKDLYRQYIDVCKKREFSYAKNGAPATEKVYNYEKIRAHIQSLQEEYIEKKQMLFNNMRQYIKESVSSIGKHL